MLRKNKSSSLLIAAVLFVCSLSAALLVNLTRISTANAQEKTAAVTNVKTGAKEEVYKYQRKGRRDPFNALLTRKIVEAEEERKRELEEEKRLAEERRIAEAQMARQPVLLLESSEPGEEVRYIPLEPEMPFPDIRIEGIMWDPFDPLLTLSADDRFYHKGDFLTDKDGDLLLVDILPDSIIVEKSKNGRVKRKQIGIIRFEEEFKK